MIITYKFRLKDKHRPELNRMARSVNFVWNYCNEASFEYLKKKEKWLSGYDLDNLTSGTSKELGILATSINEVCHTYTIKRKASHRNKLKWRSSKKTLGWVPLKRAFLIADNCITYHGTKFNFWKSRNIEGEIRSASFNEDSLGHWFLNVSCRITESHRPVTGQRIGVDLGLKYFATTSNSEVIEAGKHFHRLSSKLGNAQRARKKKLVKKIHLKIASCRKDELHKITTNLVNQYDQIFVGNVSPSKLKKTRMAKSVSDSGWSMFKSMLEYKAIRLGVDYKEINEMFSTVTCSGCLQRTGPSGLSALGVREWNCKCGASHNRDVNAAKNILRFGHESLIKGAVKCGGANKE